MQNVDEGPDDPELPSPRGEADEELLAGYLENFECGKQRTFLVGWS